MFVDFLMTPEHRFSYSLVKHVHWLRAQAQKNRWHEEVVLVTYEMQWTVRYFIDRRNKWKEGAECPTISPGAAAYASRQSNVWNDLADLADHVFKNTTIHYISPHLDIM